MTNKIKICALCQSEAHEVLTHLEGFKAGKFYDIYECQGCHTSFCDPQEIDSEIYKEIYQHRESIAGYNRYHAYFRAVKDESSPLEFLAEQEDCYWFIADYLDKNIDKQRAKLLEVGSGLGYLTYSLHKSGYNIQGVELSPVAVEDATKQFGKLYQCRNALTLADDGERFDVILLTEVIEHLTQPALFIQQLSRLLNPDGVILVTTPNKGYAANQKSQWATDLPPVHLWWFTKDGFIKIAGGTGLAVSFHSFSEWHKLNFPRALLKPAECITPMPRMNGDGSPITPGVVSLKRRSLTKRLQSMVRYALYRNQVDVSDGAIIAAVFRKC